MGKHIQLPKDVYVGDNSLNKLENYKEKNTLVVTGPTTRKIAGEEVAEKLDADIVIVEKPTKKEAERVKEKLTGKELAIGVGGGKVIDVTKTATFESGINFLSVPTTCSNDGMASQMASLQNNGTRESKVTRPPISVIVDFNIIRNCPYRLIRGGIGDTLSNFTAVKDWKLGHTVKNEYYGDYASSLSEMIARIVQKRVNEIHEMTTPGISTLIEALISSGAAMGIAGSSRPASGSEHKFSHTLDKIADKPALHGEQCGVGSIVMSYLQGEAWRDIKNALDSAECPTTAEELGIDDEIAIEAMVKAKEIKPDRYTILEHINIDREIAENALKSTEVI